MELGESGFAVSTAQAARSLAAFGRSAQAALTGDAVRSLAGRYFEGELALAQPPTWSR
jgi:hypothetical protein